MGLEYLTQSQIEQFHTDGYLLIPQIFSQNECSTMHQRAKELLQGFDVSSHPLTTFSTGEGDREHIGDDYFLSSGDKIRFFFEEDAVNSKGELRVPKDKAVNKIGHALHELDPVFRNATLDNDHLTSIARDLKFHQTPSVLQSMVICKQQRIGGAVPEHCDSTFLYTDPPSALGFWIPLERCTADNGALSFLPGSHKTNVITRRLVRKEGGGTGYEDIPGAKQFSGDGTTSSSYQLVPCEPGDLVLIHGSVLHKSERNTSDKTRFAYTFHMIESPPLAQYDEKNWLQPTKEMPFSRLRV